MTSGTSILAAGVFMSDRWSTIPRLSGLTFELRRPRAGAVGSTKGLGNTIGHRLRAGSSAHAPTLKGLARMTGRSQCTLFHNLAPRLLIGLPPSHHVLDSGFRRSAPRWLFALHSSLIAPLQISRRPQ